MEDQKSKDIRDALYLFLKDTYKTYTLPQTEFLDQMKFILIDGKSHLVKSNKKYLVNKIYNYLPDEIQRLDPVIVRQTIKKFIDDISN